MERMIIGGEKKLSDVVTRVFGALKPADAERAQSALIAVNPRLADFKTMKPGSLVLIPPVSGITPAVKPGAGGEAIPAVRVPIGEIAANFRERLLATIKVERAAIEEQGRLYTAQEAKALVREVPEAADTFKAVAAGLKDRLATLKTMEALATAATAKPAKAAPAKPAAAAAGTRPAAAGPVAKSATRSPKSTRARSRQE